MSPQNSVLCTLPGFSSHLPQPRKVILSETQHPQSYSKENVSPCFSEEAFQKTINQGTHGHNYIQLTPRQHLAKCHTPHKKLQRAQCSCIFPQTQASSLQWEQEAPSHTEVDPSRKQTSDLVSGHIPLQGGFFIHLRPKLWWYMGNFTPAWAAHILMDVHSHFSFHSL